MYYLACKKNIQLLIDNSFRDLLYNIIFYKKGISNFLKQG